MQENHPIAYLSKAVSAKNQALSTYEKECLAIIMAIEKWKYYLQHQEFIIRTDHKSLLHLTEQRVTFMIQRKAIFELMDLQFKIVYKQGISNVAVDSLSRCHEVPKICAVSSVYIEWLDKIKLGYQDDPQALKLLSEYPTEEPQFKHFIVEDGLDSMGDFGWGSISLLSNTLFGQCTIYELEVILVFFLLTAGSSNYSFGLG